MGYKLFSDVTADVSEELMRGMPEVELVPMQVELGGENYIYGPRRRFDRRAFLCRAAGGQVCQHISNQSDGLSRVF